MIKEKLIDIKNQLITLVPKFASDIAPVYAVLKLKWDKCIQGIPTEIDIATECYRMISELTDGIDGSCILSTGRLTVGYEFENGAYDLVMEFSYNVGKYIE